MDLLHDQGVLAIREISNLDFYADNQDVPIHWMNEKVNHQSYQKHGSLFSKGNANHAESKVGVW